MRSADLGPCLLLLASHITLLHVCIVDCKRLPLRKQIDMLDKVEETGKQRSIITRPRKPAADAKAHNWWPFRKAYLPECCQGSPDLQESASLNEINVGSLAGGNDRPGCEDCRSMCQLLAAAKDAGVTKTSCEQLLQHMDRSYTVTAAAYKARLARLAHRDPDYKQKFMAGKQVEFIGVRGEKSASKSVGELIGLRGTLSGTLCKRTAGGQRAGAMTVDVWEVTDIIDGCGAHFKNVSITPRNLMLVSEKPEALLAEWKLRQDLGKAVTAWAFPFHVEDLSARSSRLSSCGQVHTAMRHAWLAVSEAIQEAMAVLGGRLLLEKFHGIHYIIFEKLSPLPVRLRKLSVLDKQVIQEYCEIVEKATAYSSSFGQDSKFHWDANTLHEPLEVLLSGAHSLLNTLAELMGEQVCLV